ncbi:AAA family ATPase [Synechocystis sp. PCC 7509]|uniref:AAA family ATPase n=1 Tax=Synechocystis sp. PCC 7509 TaxID=927677 RepID=UPI0002AC1E87|nr:ATP-binding protein [Synechocystis sp. PCC 7509]
MLIEFSIGNYRSFKDTVTFSMVAADITAKDKKLDENNVFAVDNKLKLLKSAAIYGANASGKSNLVKALGFMRWFMVNSSKETQSTDEIDAEPFKLSTETKEKPSFFELVFLMDGRKYRYGFEVDKKKVVSEWLFYVPKQRETKLFERQLNNIEVTKTYKADGIQQRTRANALFLSVSAQFNVEIAEKILTWTTENLNIKFGLNNIQSLQYTVDCIIKDENKNEIIQLIRDLDLGIDDIKVDQEDLLVNLRNNLQDEHKEIIAGIEGRQAASITTSHKIFDENNKYKSFENFDLKKHESEGTQKLFALAGLIFKILKKGKIILIDEFDSSLHPLITKAIIDLFNSKETNPNNAQLVFMTHDTNLLSNKLFRRDQIWFMEKDRYGATDLYSLAEYKVRNDASFESDYIKGRYGAIPYIGKLSYLADSHV